jgi:hypothetical protein
VLFVNRSMEPSSATMPSNWPRLQPQITTSLRRQFTLTG